MDDLNTQQVPQVPQPNAALKRGHLWRPQAKSDEVPAALGGLGDAENVRHCGTSSVSASTSQKHPQISAAKVPQLCGTSWVAALSARQRFLRALDVRGRENASHRLVREYLPALRVLRTELSTDDLDALIADRERKLERAWDRADQARDDHMLRFGELLAEYEVLSDARSDTTTADLLDRIELRCPR